MPQLKEMGALKDPKIQHSFSLRLSLLREMSALVPRGKWSVFVEEELRNGLERKRVEGNS